MPHTDSPPTRASTASIMSIVAIGSLGTGAVTNGVYFISKSLYGFDRVENWALALGASAAYIGGAMCSGPMLRAAGRRWGLTGRGALGLLMLAMGVACVVPTAVREPVSLWIFNAVYHLLGGALWPLVESYVSGGRRGAGLRRATGLFNVTWAGTLPIAFWLMAPLLPDAGDGDAVSTRPFFILGALAALHACALPFVLRLPAHPARHADAGVEQPAHEAALYARLLACFRIALLVSYVFLSAIQPALPTWTAELGLPDWLRTPAASTWMVVRVGVFVWLMRWHGWHGRYRTLLWSIGALAAGAIVSFLAPSVPVLLAGLALLGVGSGAAYTAAIYYAMAHGGSEVDAGGKHESFIGLGYLSGPMFGLMAAGLVHAGDGAPSADRAGDIDRAALVLVGLAGAGLIALASWFALRRRDAPPEPGR